MKESNVTDLIKNLNADVQSLKTKLAEIEMTVRYLERKIKPKRSSYIPCEQRHAPAKPGDVRDLNASKLSVAVVGFLRLNSGKLFTSAMVIRGLLQAGYDRFGKNERVNVNTALRRTEKYGWIKRRAITSESSLWDPSGKTRFAYFFEASE